MLTATIINKSIGEVPQVNTEMGKISSLETKGNQGVVKIEASPEDYLVTLDIPDFRREDIILQTDSHVLLFSAGNQVPIPDCLEFDGQSTPSRWEKMISLPEDADTLFITAHYINGQLIIHVPRNNNPGYDKERITVYVY